MVNFDPIGIIIIIWTW